MQKTGLLFGSFNPIHIGHLTLANYLLEFAPFDEVWFIVSPQNPFKEEKGLADALHRLEMVKLATIREKRFKVSAIEFGMPIPSYTSNTLQKMKEEFPNHQFSLIIGSDNLLTFPRWHAAEEILQKYSVIVYPRPGYPVKKAKTHILNKVSLTNAPLLDISSTLIREAFAQKKQLPYMVTHEVYNYIKSKNLYEQ
ncbi:MAG: nicotinate (nicotinamide) nucleotide adenylyltransferase [Bacteroidota bacterium]